MLRGMRPFTIGLALLASLVVAFVLMYRSPKVTAPERSRLLAYIPLFIAAMLFWIVAPLGIAVWRFK